MNIFTKLILYITILCTCLACSNKTNYKFDVYKPLKNNVNPDFYTYDINSDGKKEIISVGDKNEESGKSTINIFSINPGNKTVTLTNTITTDGTVFELYFNDFNNDGLIDILAKKKFMKNDGKPVTQENVASIIESIYCEATLLINEREKSFKEAWTHRFEDVFEIASISCDDFTGDNNMDILTGGIKHDIPNQQEQVNVKLFSVDNKDTALSLKWFYEEYPKELEGVLLKISNSDINNDKHQDFIALINNGKDERTELLSFVNDGTGNFINTWKNKEDEIIFYSYDFKMADLNIDGYDDIIIKLRNNDNSKSYIALFMNSKTGSFIKEPFKTNIKIEDEISGFDIGDFDGDGDKDIVLATADSANSRISIYSNNNMQFEKVWENHLLKDEKKPDHVVGFDHVWSISAFDFDNAGKSDFGVVTEHVRFNHLTKEENIRIEMQIFKNISIK